MTPKPKKKKLFKFVLITLYVVTFLVFFYYLFAGLPYYMLPMTERPFSPLHDLFKPGGLIGHKLGMVGTGMMLLMLLYSVRKRVAFFANWGSIKNVLNLHIYLGVMGPLFILLHTSFKFGGIVAVSFWSMAAVAASGFVGRYLYIKIPQEIKERRERVSEHTDFIENQNQKWQTDLESKAGDESSLQEAEAKYGQIEPTHKSEDMKPSQNIGVFLLQMVFHDIFNFFYLRRVSRNYSNKHHIARKEFKKIRKALIQRTKLANEIKFLKEIEHLFHYWHVIHRPFAYVMLTILFVHVVIALVLGYV